ncbi:acetyltransferase [Psychromonas marina]|uniref:Acetyltransferase n=1 Tax=Psychromonas marina TaxID=88364 RepID=A0ABQ6DZ40_9GAMM|nr:GNAT family N-acetyltransferase [Psychromonas marina]GLS90357.1 acetyltransferase [Psychromonas marina]
MINIRNFDINDVAITWNIKFNTIRTINRQDYTVEQTKRWAPEHYDMNLWRKRITDMNPFIAELDGNIVGFADLQDDGYIDHFFCHSEYQGAGVGRALMEHILSVGASKGISRFYSQVSLTARCFYEHFGFHVVKEQQVAIADGKLTNFVMQKIT